MVLGRPAYGDGPAYQPSRYAIWMTFRGGAAKYTRARVARIPFASTRPRFVAGEEGQSVVLVALMFTLLMGFAAASVDIGRFYVERRFLQSAVDAAALACARAYVDSGRIVSKGWAAGNDVLVNHNLLGDPLGLSTTITKPADYGAEEYDNGIFTPKGLNSGIVPVDTPKVGCRVATTVAVPTYFLKVLSPGFATISMTTRGYARSYGGMLPIVVNRYKDPPGPSTTFVDYTKQEEYQIANPNVCSSDDPAACPDAAYSPLGCTSGCLWGPETIIVGSGYNSSDSDFRGFIALDIRDFTSVDPGTGDPIHKYYNNTSGLNTNQLKDQESYYVRSKTYPGPQLDAYIPGSSPVQAGLQIATMSGNSTGVVVDDFNSNYLFGDLILGQVFDGQVRTIPDFTIGQLTAISANSPSGPATGPTVRVGANQSFRADNSTVTLAMARDTYNGSSSDTPTQLHDFTFSPNNFIPAGGAGTTITINDLQVDGGVPTGIYSVVISGTGYNTGGTQLATHVSYVPLNIGGVVRDFSLNFAGTVSEIAVGDPTAVFSATLSTTSGSSAWGSNPVAMALDQGTCSAGQVALMRTGTQYCVTATVNATSNLPDKNSPPTVTTTFQTSTLSSGVYTTTMRSRGTNQSGQPVVHVTPLQINVGTTSGGARSYVNVQGYVVFMITSSNSNTIYGRAVSREFDDPDEAGAALGRLVRLYPWDAD